MVYFFTSNLRLIVKFRKYIKLRVYRETLVKPTLLKFCCNTFFRKHQIQRERQCRPTLSHSYPTLPASLSDRHWNPLTGGLKPVERIVRVET